MTRRWAGTPTRRRWHGTRRGPGRGGGANGLKGLPEVVENVWPRTIVQTCVVHRSCKEIKHRFRSCGSLRWYGHVRRGAGAVGGEVRGVAAASERTSAAFGVGR